MQRCGDGPQWPADAFVPRSNPSLTLSSNAQATLIVVDESKSAVAFVVIGLYAPKSIVGLLAAQFWLTVVLTLKLPVAEPEAWVNAGSAIATAQNSAALAKPASR